MFPSRTDTFGLVMLEAMASGTPVAAYPVTGPIDVVKPGITGVLRHRPARGRARGTRASARRGSLARAHVVVEERDRAVPRQPAAHSMPEGEFAESPHKGQRGLRRLFNAFLYSLSGLRLAFRHESAFRQEMALAAVLLPLACMLPVEPVERVMLIASVLMVLIVELLNSSVEAAVDRIGFDSHRLSKRAKDLGSAAVLLALVVLTVVWGLLAIPALMRIAAMFGPGK